MHYSKSCSCYYRTTLADALSSICMHGLTFLFSDMVEFAKDDDRLPKIDPRGVTMDVGGVLVDCCSCCC